MTDLTGDWPVFTGPVTHEDIHWRLPDGLLACGARHIDNTQVPRIVCCRLNPCAATCSKCVRLAAKAVA